jgi:hypothetical protein
VDRDAFSIVTESLLARGLSVRFRAGGLSMAPSVRDGECVIVAPVDARDVAIGDVVLCETWRGPLAHRVLGFERDAFGTRRFVLRGDASLENDPPVAASQLRGHVVSVERDGRSRSLAIPGGVFGRRLFAAALRARPKLVAAARAVLSGRPALSG